MVLRIAILALLSSMSSHADALKGWGANAAWGTYYLGALGTGNTSLLLLKTPVTVPGLFGIKQISVSPSHTLALMNDGTVRGWGDNIGGALGMGYIDDAEIYPVMVPGLYGVKQVAAGRDYSLALMNDGTVRAWGDNSYGQLGLGLSKDGKLLPLPPGAPTTSGLYVPTSVAVPTKIPGLYGVQQISAGAMHALALMSNGTVKVWGYNKSGVLGVGANAPEIVAAPLEVTGLSGVKQISAGLKFSFALMSNGTVRAWGRNNLGQLGVGLQGDKKSPVVVPLANVKQISASCNGDHSLALLNDGTVKAWGLNTSGQLGLGNKTNKSIPTIVPGLYGVSQVSAGEGHSLALMNDGTVKAWGKASYGQLGIIDLQLKFATFDEPYTDLSCKTLPTPILLLPKASQIGAGGNRGFAICK